MPRSGQRYSFEPGADLFEFLRAIDSPTSFIRRALSFARHLRMHESEGTAEFAAIEDLEQFARLREAYDPRRFDSSLGRVAESQITEAWHVLLDHGFEPAHLLVIIQGLVNERWRKPRSIDLNTLATCIANLPATVDAPWRTLSLTRAQRERMGSLASNIGFREGHFILVLVDELDRGNQHLESLLHDCA